MARRGLRDARHRVPSGSGTGSNGDRDDLKEGGRSSRSAECRYRGILRRIVGNRGRTWKSGRAYRVQLTMITPTRSPTLGGEFYDLATREPRRSFEAYEHLKNRYAFK